MEKQKNKNKNWMESQNIELIKQIKIREDAHNECCGNKKLDMKKQVREFRWRAITSSGKKVFGSHVAFSSNDVKKELELDGYTRILFM